MFDTLRDKVSGFMGSSGIDAQLKDIRFPASKEELLRQMEQKGVPHGVVNKVRSLDVAQFDSIDDVKQKLGR